MKSEQLVEKLRSKKNVKSFFRIQFQRMIMIPLFVLALVFSGIYLIEKYVLAPAILHQANLNSLEQQINQLNRQIRHYQKYAVEFEERGEIQLTQKLNRIEWVYSVTSYAMQNNLFQFGLNFGQEVKFLATQASRLPIQQEVFFHTPVTVDVGLYHEGDLIQLIDWMRVELSPYLWLKTCQLRLLRSVVADAEYYDPARPNIHAHCEFINFRAEPRLFNEQEWR